MDKPERSEGDDAQRAKLIFMSLAAAAAVVMILLIWSLYSGNKARAERDAATLEVETLKQDSARLEQLLKDQNQKIDELDKKLKQCEAKAKAKPAAKKKPAAKTTKKAAKTKKQK